eukprot:scaffold18065_cov111-Isochrysis_galbana.AAC.3
MSPTRQTTFSAVPHQPTAILRMGGGRGNKHDRVRPGVLKPRQGAVGCTARPPALGGRGGLKGLGSGPREPSPSPSPPTIAHLVRFRPRLAPRLLDLGEVTTERIAAELRDGHGCVHILRPPGVGRVRVDQAGNGRHETADPPDAGHAELEGAEIVKFRESG